MATYKFEQFNTEIKDPTILLHGSVGTKFKEGTAELLTFADVLLITDSTRQIVTLTDNSTPDSWSEADLIKWVDIQMQKNEV
jgi:hypothetical protein